MKKVIGIIFCILAFAGCTQSEFTAKKGVNISHWLSQSNDRGEIRATRFTREDVKFIAEAGFDHIRIPIDEEQMFDKDLNPDSEAFSLLHNALGWCKEFNLCAVVDLHILRSHHFNADERPLFTQAQSQEQFYECWRKISDELSRYPCSMVAYELMNEPVADDPEQWNTILNRCIKVVRNKEPKRTIIAGANRWQSYDQVKYLRVPADDENIIISFHLYNPFPFTHYRGSWTYFKDVPVEITYPGYLANDADFEYLSPELQHKWGWLAKEYYDITTLEEQIKQAVDAAQALGKRIYLGEFGVIKGTADAARDKWYQDIVTICKKYDISYATWDYQGGFGIIRDGVPVESIIKTLTRE